MPKQENGPWKIALAGGVKAIRRAYAIIFVNPTGEACFENLRGKRLGLQFIPPFIEAKSPMTASERLKLREYLATEFEIDTSMPWLLCVAMMRLGAKRDPCRVLANAMADRTRQSFPLLIAGSGAVLSAVVEFFIEANSVRFVGECSPRKPRELHAAADLFVWLAAIRSWQAIPPVPRPLLMMAKPAF